MEELVQLTPSLYDKCQEYLSRRKVSEKTRVLYTKELDKIFKYSTLTQRLYNSVFTKGNYYRSVLKLIIDTCKFNDIIAYNYKTVKPIKRKIRLPQVWGEEQIIKAADNIEDYGLLILCAYYIGAGLRFSSAIMLSWDDFVWEDWIKDKTKTGRCKITAKGNKEAFLIVDPILMNKLFDLAERTGKVFLGVPYKNSDNDLYLFIKRIDLEALHSLYKKENFDKILDSKGYKINVVDRAKTEIVRKKHYLVDYRLRKLRNLFNNRKIKFHSIRHSRATNLLKRGFKLMTIKEQLMHNSIATTEIYLNLVNVDMDMEFEEKLGL